MLLLWCPARAAVQRATGQDFTKTLLSKHSDQTCFVRAKLWQFQQRKSLALCSPCRYCCRTYKGHPSKHTTECKSLLFAHMLAQQSTPCAQENVASGAQACALQLNRFRLVQGTARKVLFHASIPHEIQIPVWHGAEVLHTTYCLQAMIVHLGESMHAGHYRSVLVRDDRRWYYTNDNAEAVLVHRDTDFREIAQNVYIAFYARK